MAKAKEYSYEYPMHSLTVDCVVFGLDEDELKVILIQRGEEPFKDQWALPGGFVKLEETVDAAACRELEEETGIHKDDLEQLYTFGAVDRDPRGRVVTVAYYGLVNLSGHVIRATTDAKNAAWFGVHDCPPLPFDHDKISEKAYQRLQGKVRYQPIGFGLLPVKFTLTQLQRMYEIILEKALDKRNFRKKILAMNLLIDCNEIEQDVAHRAARLYRFDKPSYDRLVKSGFNFEI